MTTWAVDAPGWDRSTASASSHAGLVVVVAAVTVALPMHHRRDGIEHVERVTPGRLCVVVAGDEHMAHGAPNARILVIERKGSI